MIHIEKLGVSLGKSTISNLTLLLEEGESSIIYSTDSKLLTNLAKRMAGLCKSYSGLISINGHNQPNDYRQSVHYISPANQSNSRLTVSELLSQTSCNLTQLHNDISTCQLDSYLSTPLSDLPVSICECLSVLCAIQEPRPYILIDQPSVISDPIQKKQVAEVYQYAMTKATVIFLLTCMDPPMVSNQRVIILKNGTLFHDSSISELTKESSGKIKMSCRTEDDQIVNKINKLSCIKTAIGVKDDGSWTIEIEPVGHNQACRERLFILAAKEKWGLHSLTEMIPELDQKVAAWMA